MTARIRFRFGSALLLWLSLALLAASCGSTPPRFEAGSLHEDVPAEEKGGRVLFAIPIGE